MKAIINSGCENQQVIEFDDYTRIKFQFGDDPMKFMEVGVGQSWNGQPCLDIRSGWDGLSVEPSTSNVVKIKMTEK